jgi:hypothetical protein
MIARKIYVIISVAQIEHLALSSDIIPRFAVFVHIYFLPVFDSNRRDIRIVVQTRKKQLR